MAGADDAAFAALQRAIFYQCRFQVGADFGTQIHFRFEPRKQRALAAGDFGFDRRQRGQRVTDVRQIARAGAAGGDSRQQALHVVDAAQFFAQLVAQAAIGHQFRHSVETLVDRRQIGQRIGDPIGQQPRTH